MSPASGARPAVDAYAPGSGDVAWDALHYDLAIDYRMATNRLDGVARITGRATTELRAIVLDLVGLRVSRATLDGARLPHTARGPHVTVRPATPIPAGGRFELEVAYAGQPAGPRPNPAEDGDAELGVPPEVASEDEDEEAAAGETAAGETAEEVED